MGDPGTDEEQPHGDNYSCYVELGPVSGQQNNLRRGNTLKDKSPTGYAVQCSCQKGDRIINIYIII